METVQLLQKISKRGNLFRKGDPVIQARPIEWIKNQLTKCNRSEVLQKYQQFKNETPSKMTFASFKSKVIYYDNLYKQAANDPPLRFPPPPALEKDDFNHLVDEVSPRETSENTVKATEEMSDSIYKAVLDSTWIKTPEQLIEYLGIDMDVWELTKFIRNTWGSEANPNIQVKGEFKKKIQQAFTPNYKEVAQHIVEEYQPKPFPSKPQSRIDTNEDAMLEIVLTDHHLGQLSDPDETMSAPYDLNVASSIARSCIGALFNRAHLFGISKTVLVLGNDFFNSDNLNNTTTSGTPQVEASRWQKTFTKGIEVCVDLIETCLDWGQEVEVVMVPGNHDFERSYYLGCALFQRYSKHPRVTINNSPTPRKYVSWGKCLICFTHGADEAKGTLPLLISREVPKLWGQAKFVEVHKGHIHKEQEKLILTDEEVGIKERILPSLVARDDWHTRKGYLSTRESMAFIWHKTKGCEAILKYHPEVTS